MNLIYRCTVFCLLFFVCLYILLKCRCSYTTIAMFCYNNIWYYMFIYLVHSNNLYIFYSPNWYYSESLMIIYILTRGCFFAVHVLQHKSILMEVNQIGLVHCLGSKATCSLYKNNLIIKCQLNMKYYIIYLNTTLWTNKIVEI